MRYKGVTITPVKITRYEVRDPSGKVIKRTDKLSEAKMFVRAWHMVSSIMRREPE